MDKKKIAADLRLEAGRLAEEAAQLRQAADVLDPLPRQSTLFEPSSAQDSATQTKPVDDSRRETVVDIAVDVLQKRGGALPKEQIFEQVQARGGRVASMESFVSILSRAKDKLVSRGSGLWSLPIDLQASTDSSAHSHSGERPTIEDIRGFLRGRNARVPDVAKHFHAAEQFVRDLIADPQSGILVNGPGWLKVNEFPAGDPTNYSSGGG